MRHLYPENIFEYMIHKLFRNWFDKKKLGSGGHVSHEFLDNTKPLKATDVINHLIQKRSADSNARSILFSNILLK